MLEVPETIIKINLQALIKFITIMTTVFILYRNKVNSVKLLIYCIKDMNEMYINPEVKVKCKCQIYLKLHLYKV